MKNNDFRNSSQIFSANSIFISELYDRFLKDRNSVDASWQNFFDNIGDDLHSIEKDYDAAKWRSVKPKVLGAVDDSLPVQQKDKKSKDGAVSSKDAIPSLNMDVLLEFKVAKLIDAYRKYGHIYADLDPLDLYNEKNYAKELDIANFGITESDLKKEVVVEGFLGNSKNSISFVINKLKDIYCKNSGYEYTYIENQQEVTWLKNNIEKDYELSKDEKISILNELVKIEGFEQFIHKRFPGAKRFSAEGGDSSIVAIKRIVDKLVSECGAEEIEIGMAHRGRLNVLTNVMQKPFYAIFSEFRGNANFPDSFNIAGDVKYHMGYSVDKELQGKKYHMSLAFNPSHLEAVNPVVVGKVRAKQDRLKDTNRNNVVAILIHGDAAFMGQGCVAETFNLYNVDGYRTGGTIHIVVNNQIGFTANSYDSRSTRYCSDIAKIISCPVIHVNGDDIDAVIKASDIAARYKNEFKKDIVIDVVCYRRYGHNEGDEPLYTQPIMYNIVKNTKTVATKYSEKLASENVADNNYFEKIKKEFFDLLEVDFKKGETYKPKEADTLKGVWKNLSFSDDSKKKEVKTGVNKSRLIELAHILYDKPKGFELNSKIEKLLESKMESINSGHDIDWSIAENLAFATLVDEKFGVRITGQDSKRGTFSHRHSVLFDKNTQEEYIALQKISENQGTFEVSSSVLSEFAVMGFEYGYSLANPNSLVIWEAQFGDFANGAQTIFDQFISSGETKWLRMSGLTLLLPHGYEGQGPEHSSARLERYLQACADNNIQVANCTSPANFFHLLRRQLHRDYRKPLVVMTPKSLLRHKLAVSDLSEMDKNTSFRPLIGEIDKIANDTDIKRVVLCSGKVYYDLLEARREKNIKNVAIIRVEELYPFPAGILSAELGKYKNASEIIWCQEEPKNMGAWSFVNPLIEDVLIAIKSKASRPIYVGRVPSASPASGYLKVHNVEQLELINKAINM